MAESEYDGFTLARPHNCKAQLPNAAKFHAEHRGQILMCDYCKTKWAVYGSGGNGHLTYWWEPYQGAAE